jgi:hypothetical protein
MCEVKADIYERFQRDGYAVLESFFNEKEVEQMKDECFRLVEQMDPSENRTVFKTGNKQVGDDYFINSGDKIRYFLEEGAVDDEGNLKVEKHRCLNKVGHALHWLSPVFKAITFSEKIKSVAKNLQMVDPAVVQSMCIFKQPFIGGEVIPHQDSTFLYTEPPSAIGLWIALEDATLDNGCLWFAPGSHKDNNIPRRMIRNPDPTGPILTFTAPNPTYEGFKYIPAPVPAGSLVVIHGSVVHKSSPNNSPVSRYVYTFHLVEKKDTKYSDQNWLQPTRELPFPGLYDVNP